MHCTIIQLGYKFVIITGITHCTFINKSQLIKVRKKVSVSTYSSIPKLSLSARGFTLSFNKAIFSSDNARPIGGIRTV